MPIRIMNLPIPSEPTKASSTPKYPLAKLEVGQSFVVPNMTAKDRLPWEDQADAAHYPTIKVHVSRWNRKGDGKKFGHRVSPEDDRYIQVWRSK